jgi:hypothetical protein
MGRQWLDIQRDKDIYPYLRYVTAGDERVRETHRQLEGTTLPVDSPFWQQYYPPNGWNCRCTVKKLMEAENINNEQSAMKIAETDTPTYFRKNVGMTDIFDTATTPYFENMPKELEAVRDYGLHIALRDKGRKPLAILPDSTEILPSAIDFEGLPIENRIKKQKALYNEVILDPDEVWSDKHKIYMKFYADTAVIITVKEGTVTNIKTMTYDQIEQYRAGILNHKKRENQ